MRGLELSEKYYLEFGAQMIHEKFPDIEDILAVGLCGSGSECYGFDDEISKDHDFEPSLCIWIDEESEREFGFRLFRTYTKLQKEYSQINTTEKSLRGSDSRGVMTISDFYRQYTGRDGAPETLKDWVYTPSYYLAEAVNGQVFCDPYGRFTEIRDKIKNGMPEDARLKKIASCAFHMAQSGQYNYKRCLSHGELGAARLALSDFVKSAIDMVFLLNRRHTPYYKWSFRAMRELEILGQGAFELERLINKSGDQALEISREIEKFCACVISELIRQGLSDSHTDYLENHAYSINGRIKDHELRNSHIML